MGVGGMVLAFNYPLLNSFYAPGLKLSFQQSQEVNAV